MEELAVNIDHNCQLPRQATAEALAVNTITIDRQATVHELAVNIITIA